jgi:Cu-Zn family superoxide dismutase
MRSILVLSVLALAACDQDRNERNDRANNRPPPPPGSPADASHPMGRPDMPPDHPPMGHDMGRGEMGRDGNFRVDPSDPNSAMIEELVATVSGDATHKDIKGTVTFRMQGGSTLVDANVDGLPKGEHGYHVHVFGDCSDLTTKSPGTHLDFHAGMGGMGGPNGSNMPPSTPGGTVAMAGSGSGSGSAMPMGTTDMVDASGSHVMGNLGELTADASGHATGSRTVDARLRQLLGRAVVIHEKGNDDSKTDGAAGTPIACGVIGIANPAEKASAAKEPEQK